MKEQVKKYIISNIKNIMLFGLIYVFGIVAGFVIFAFLGSGNRLELIEMVRGTINIANLEGYEGINIIQNGMQINAIVMAIFMFSAFTVVSFAIVSLVILLKGISLSIYICILFSVFGPLKGILSTILVAIVPNLILMIIYIFLGIECIKVSNEILIRITKNSVMRSIFKVLILSLTSVPFVMLSTWLEQIFFRLIV